VVTVTSSALDVMSYIVGRKCCFLLETSKWRNINTQ